MAEETKLVAAASKGYNYNYTSLADLVRQDIKLPPMRVATLTDGTGTPVIVDGQPIEYIEALVNNEWIRGARIVIPTGNKMNEAQAYGSALTYARRYTALTILGIACDDDNKIEVHSKEESEVCLGSSQISALHNMIRKIERLCSFPAYVDWAFDRGKLYIIRLGPMDWDIYEEFNK